ncbi:hypothetical protein BC628DRAFT_1415333 [Trametes gibbosa]|nr:hypothetical protein BC628DRAFT_1415333 [Trametes gibbosa]
MSYDSGHVGIVEPLVYGSRMARLFARTTDGEGSTTTNGTSHSSTSNGGSHPVNPAVPALIAVTVFVLCTLVFYKGIRALRGHGVVPVYRKPVEEEKPRMWEVHLNRPSTPPCVPAVDGWDRLMPVAVEFLPPYEPRSPPPLSGSSIRPPLRACASTSTRGSRSPSRDTPRTSWSSFPEKRPASFSKDFAEDDPARMRVAVIIAMPSPPSSPSASEPAPPAPAYLGLADV